MNTSAKYTRYKGHRSSSRGFALVATISVMVLLVIVALAVLSLSTIETRNSQQGRYQVIARANARMALMLAIGELQKSMGSDQRVSANASVLDANPDTSTADGISQSGLLGVWESWSPKYTDDPTGGAPDYDSEKENRFRRWLVSHPNSELLESLEYVESAADESSSVKLFDASEPSEIVHAPLVQGSSGQHAWAVRGEGSRAKINVRAAGGAGGTSLATNEGLVVPPRVGYEISEYFEKLPAGSPDLDRLLDHSQIDLSEDIQGAGYNAQSIPRHFTTHSMGLLTDTVDGGLKLDLSLAFELEKNEFDSPDFNGVPNPLMDASNTGYRGERTLFKPIVTEKEQTVVVDYGTDEYGRRLNLTNRFRLSSVPTFTSLRSYYRLYRHLYQSRGDTTVFEKRPFSSLWSGVRGGPQGDSTVGAHPVLDRLMFFIQMRLDSDKRLQVVLTPVVTLWNPYNVALECEGFSLQQWMDYPVKTRFWITKKGDTSSVVSGREFFLSQFLGAGRHLRPYFFLALTENGNGNTSSPIHFQPGEVKVFSLVSNTPQLYEYDFSSRNDKNGKNRQFHMKPVASPSELNLRGGIAISMNRPVGGTSAIDDVIEAEDKVDVRLEFHRYDYLYYVDFEDSTRLKLGDPTEEDPHNPKAWTLATIQSFNNLDPSTGKADRTSRATMSGGELQANVVPIGVLETYHRTALSSVQASSDLVQSINPRQMDMTHFFSQGRFRVSPNYSSNLRTISSINGSGVQFTADGRRSFYGASNSTSSGGEDYLAFFEIPRQPPLSLASFQHADMSATSYSSAYQFGNSWASPYLERDQVAKIVRSTPTGLSVGPSRVGFPVYDYSTLVNEALWDKAFLSSAAAQVSLKPEPNATRASHNGDMVNIQKSVSDVVKEFVQNPNAAPLRNKRFKLYTQGLNPEDLGDKLTAPDGFRHMAGHLLVDGMFNVNSVSEEAWKAVLASARGTEFIATELPSNPETVGGADNTPFTRMQNPTKVEDPIEAEAWSNFRNLTDEQIGELAKYIVEGVKERGPFLSLAEFVNRRIDESDEGLTGVLQDAIQKAGFNDDYKYDPLDVSQYAYPNNFTHPYTGTGAPGFLTQADLLMALGPFITTRSDTFTIRTYGDARDSTGKIRARVYCEAVVQRTPEFVDASQEAATPVDSWNETNQKFGRRFNIVSFRYMNANETL